MTPLHRCGVALVCMLLLGIPAMVPLTQAVAVNHPQSSMVTLPDAVSALLRQHSVRPQAVVRANRSLLVTLGLPLRHQRQLNWFITHDALHGHYMTQAQFAARFAPTAKHVAQVEGGRPLTACA